MKMFKKMRLLLLVPLVFIAVNCQNEDVDLTKSTPLTENEITSKVVSLQDLRNMPEFKGKFSGFRTKSNDTVRKIVSRKFDFWIETDKVLVTQKGNYNSFTFKVFRDVSSAKLENFVLHPYNGGYLPYLIRYDFDAKDLQNFENGLPIANILEKTEIRLLHNLDMTDLGLPIATFGNSGGYTQAIYWFDNKCWVYHTTEGGYDIFVVYTGEGCHPPSEGSGGVPEKQYLYLDFRGDYGRAVGSGNNGGGSGGSGEGSGSGGIFNPTQGSHPPGADDSQVPNGPAVIGIFGPGVDLNKAVNAQKIENQITSGDADDCSNSVIQELKTLGDQDIAKMITKFDSSPSAYVLDIKTEAFQTNAGTPAQTGWTPGYAHYHYTIKLHPDYMSNSNKLGRAAIIIHEIVHAYFLSLIDDQGAGDPNATYEIAELFEAYVTKTFGPNSEMIQHQVMADKYVDVIARALQEYNTGSAVAPGENPSQVYTDIAWGGLSHAPVFQTLPTADKERISKRYAAEVLNITVGTEIPAGESCD